MLEDRRVVRIVLMRSTIHLVLADDAAVLRPLTQVVTERGLATSWGRFLADLDLAAVAAAGRALVEAEPATPKAVGEALRARWPDRDAGALFQVVRAFVPLVQLPPRAVWGRSGAQRHTSAEAWLGRPMATDASPDDLVLRYVGAFGPAKAADLRAWWGIAGARELLEVVRPRLRTFRDERGAELFDVPDAPVAEGDEPAPVRFLPDYDNVLLGHADRRRILRVDLRDGLVGTPTVLVDGFVGATWKVDRAKGSATIVVTPFAKVPKADRASLVAEGRRTLRLTDPDAEHDVRIEAAGPPPRSPSGPAARSPGARSRGAGRRG
jgi:hypothetical protein